MNGNWVPILTSANGLNYGSDWEFDSSLVISVCSDLNKANSIACQAQDLKVFYRNYEVNSMITFANSGSLSFVWCSHSSCE